VPPLKLSRVLEVRISAADHDRLRATAASLNLNVSEFVRRSLTERMELESVLDIERVTDDEAN
jgi:predicted HicB family RNase H-like nuclease